MELRDLSLIFSIFKLPVSYVIYPYLVKRQEGKLFYEIASQKEVEELFQEGKIDHTTHQVALTLLQLTPFELHKQLGLSRAYENPALEQERVRQFIQSRIAQVFPHLSQLPLYLGSKDGYPAFKKITVETEKALPRIHLRKEGLDLAYAIRLYLKNQPLPLYQREVDIFLINPFILLIDQKWLVPVEKMDPKRLTPFFKVVKITIPPEKQAHYVDSYLKPLLKCYPVETENISVRDPHSYSPCILVSWVGNYEVMIQPKMQYEGERFSLDPESPLIPFWSKQDGFALLRRKVEVEKQFGTLFEQKLGSQQQLLQKSIPITHFLEWIPELRKWNVSIHTTPLGRKHFLPVLPELKLQATDQGGGWLLTGTLQWDAYAISLQALTVDLTRPVLEIAPNILVSMPTSLLLTLHQIQQQGKQQEEGIWLSGLYRHLLNALYAYAQGTSMEEAKQIEVALPKTLNGTPRSYQKEGYYWLYWLWKYGQGGILADEMGLGKTFQVTMLLAKLYEEGEAKPTLIIVPASLLYHWKQEIERFAPSLRVFVYHGPHRELHDFHMQKFQIFLTTYSTARIDIEKLQRYEYSLLILDESHYVKNSQAKTTKALFKIKSHFKLGLTGTPIENQLMELWTQFHLLNPMVLGKKAVFEREFLKPIEAGNEMKLLQLREMIKPFVLRRTKQEVAKELPEKVEQVIPCEMTQDQAQYYFSYLSQLREHIERRFGENPLERMQILSYLQYLRQIAIHPVLVDPAYKGESNKEEMILEFIEDIIANQESVLVFSQYVKFLKRLQVRLTKKKIPHLYLDGTTQNRDAIIQQFQKGTVPVFLLSIKAGGVGLNLTQASYVIISEPNWNPAIEWQAIDRTHRIGQQKTVFIYRFITQKTIEEYMLEVQQRKAHLASELIRSEQDILKLLEEEGFERLFNHLSAFSFKKQGASFQ